MFKELSDAEKDEFAMRVTKVADVTLGMSEAFFSVFASGIGLYFFLPSSYDFGHSISSTGKQYASAALSLDGIAMQEAAPSLEQLSVLSTEISALYDVALSEGGSRAKMYEINHDLDTLLALYNPLVEGQQTVVQGELLALRRDLDVAQSNATIGNGVNCLLFGVFGCVFFYLGVKNALRDIGDVVYKRGFTPFGASVTERY
jgi:hypothetical protein